MPLITDSEMDDFDAVILKAGFDVHDFRVIDLEDEPTAKEQHPNTGTVTVHRISTGHAITYRADSVPHGWQNFWLISTQANTACHRFERLRRRPPEKTTSRPLCPELGFVLLYEGPDVV